MIQQVLRSMIRAALLVLADKLAEPIVQASVCPDLKNAQPQIYKELDKQMPMLLQRASPVLMTTVIAGIAETAVKRRISAADLRALVRDYNPIAAVAGQITK